jgi:ribose transport system substrate-binding protein
MNFSSQLALGAAIATLTFGAAVAQDKQTLAIVVKGLDNPFFEQINLGCQDWAANNSESEYECLYTGPASSADEAGQVQLVDDLITRGVAAIAISPSNAPAMGNRLREIAPDIPVMTVDADLAEADRSLRKTFLGTDNYLMGVMMAEQAMRLKPDGGTVCLQLGNVAADNINARAAGFRDTASGAKGTDRLDAFILIGGWAQFAPQAYAQVTDQVMDRLSSNDLIIIAGDTLPPQVQAFNDGRSHVQVGQRPFEMGQRAPDVMIQLINGETVKDPIYTGLDVCTREEPGFCAQ